MVLIPDPRWAEIDSETAGRIADEDVLCDSCGYTLKYLPRKGRCPECGSDYNTEGHNSDGVFDATGAEFPFMDALLASFSVIMLVWMGLGVLRQPELWLILMTAMMAVITPLFVRHTWRRIQYFLHIVRLERHVADD